MELNVGNPEQVPEINVNGDQIDVSGSEEPNEVVAKSEDSVASVQKNCEVMELVQNDESKVFPVVFNIYWVVTVLFGDVDVSKDSNLEDISKDVQPVKSRDALLWELCIIPEVL